MSLAPCFSNHALSSSCLLACVVATTDEVVRLYDVTTLKCFKPALANELHAGGIQQAVYSPLASMYATCGVDGHIRLWDGVNNKCIRTLESAHQSHSVSPPMLVI